MGHLLHLHRPLSRATQLSIVQTTSQTAFLLQTVVVRFYTFFFLQMERVANVIGPRSPVTDASSSRQIS